MKYGLKTFLLLVVASFVVSCGFGSKPVEQPTLEEKLYSLSGTLSGIGEEYNTDDHDVVKDIHIARSKDLELTSQLTSLKAISEALKTEAEKGKEIEDAKTQKVAEALKKNAESLAELEKKVAFQIDSLTFSVKKEEDKYIVSDLDIRSEDKDQLETVEKDNPDTKDVNEEKKVLHKYFGDLNELHLKKEAQFDEKTGMLSFSFVLDKKVEDKIESEKYTFTSDSLEEITKEGEDHKTVIVKGHYDVKKLGLDEKGQETESVIRLGTWEVSQKIDLKKEETKKEETEKTEESDTKTDSK